MSGAYASVDICSEFGLVPPSFLPLGNKVALVQQLALLKKDSNLKECIYIVLPDTYELNTTELRLLEREGVNVLKISSLISLSEALKIALYNIKNNQNNGQFLKLLMGDTVFNPSTKLITYDSSVATFITTANDYYPRTKIKTVGSRTRVSYEWSEPGDHVWTGYLISDFDKIYEYFCSTKSSAVSIEGFFNTCIGLESLIEINASDWLDLGHVNSLYEARTRFSTSRSFNSLRFQNGIVDKKSDKPGKDEAESKWYEFLPREFTRYTPKYLGRAQDSYTMEAVRALPLSELYVNGKLPFGVWQGIISRVIELLADMAKFGESGGNLEAACHFRKKIALKNVARVKSIDEGLVEKAFSTQEPTLKKKLILERVNKLNDEYMKSPLVPALVHGDLCFSNMMRDGKSNCLTVYDPMGINEYGVYGDLVYDISKLYHSLHGFYDFIISDKVEVDVDCKNLIFIDTPDFSKQIKDYFLQNIARNFGINEKTILGVTVLLFYSMIPLHSDCEIRQLRFMIRANDLYNEWEVL